MSWSSPLTWLANQVVTAAQLNTHLRDNLNELRQGGIAMASQDVNDFIYATSSTQLGRVGTAGAGGSGRVPTYISPGWQLKSMWPVGSIYISVDPTNPGTTFGFGTWVAFAAGRVLVGIDATQTEFDTVEETGGAKTVTLTTGEVPALTVGLSGVGGSSNTIAAAKGGAQSDSVTTNGSGGSHTNLQPYITVYMWKRTV